MLFGYLGVSLLAEISHMDVPVTTTGEPHRL